LKISLYYNNIWCRSISPPYCLLWLHNRLKCVLHAVVGRMVTILYYIVNFHLVLSTKYYELYRTPVQYENIYLSTITVGVTIKRKALAFRSRGVYGLINEMKTFWKTRRLYIIDKRDHFVSINCRYVVFWRKKILTRIYKWSILCIIIMIAVHVFIIYIYISMLRELLEYLIRSMRGV